MFYPLERLSALHDGYRKTFRLGRHDILLVQHDGKPRVLTNQCPHQQAPLSDATLTEQGLRCSAHGLLFDLTTGRSQFCKNSLIFWPIHYDGSVLGVDIEAT